MTDSRLSWEQVPLSGQIDLGEWVVSAEEITHFARQFDPQPFHLDERIAAASPLGGLAASGWHSLARLMRQKYDRYLIGIRSQGAPGVEEVRWRRPVLAGQVLRLRGRALEKRPMASRPDLGMIRHEFTITDAKGEVALSERHWLLVARAEPGPPPPPRAPRAPEPPVDHASTTPPEAASPDSLFADTTPLLQRQFLGEAVLTPEQIIAFARDYDPQPFHLSEEAGRQTHFGGLVASGWHTGALWMRKAIDLRYGLIASLPKAEQAAAIAAQGPASGIFDLEWRAPTRPGQVLRFYTMVTGRETSRLPGWSALTLQNEVTDTAGRVLMRFRSRYINKERG